MMGGGPHRYRLEACRRYPIAFCQPYRPGTSDLLNQKKTDAIRLRRLESGRSRLANCPETHRWMSSDDSTSSEADAQKLDQLPQKA